MGALSYTVTNYGASRGQAPVLAATAHVGHYIPAGELVEIECEQGGTVSVRDIA